MLKFLLNKYLIAIIFFVIWVVFFDKNDVMTQYEQYVKCQKLQLEKAHYLEEIEKNKSDLQDLSTNAKSLEKFAREKYYMKKDNEDIYVIVQKK